jgi:hypothetical protein
MLLSDAIALGQYLIEEPDASTFCRCAIGMGLAAIGQQFHVGSADMYTGHALARAEREWPWLKTQLVWSRWVGKEVPAEVAISHAFYAVECGCGYYTLDELIEWVRSIEPPESTGVEERKVTNDFVAALAS